MAKLSFELPYSSVQTEKSNKLFTVGQHLFKVNKKRKNKKQ